jgi:hypothetical protein
MFAGGLKKSTSAVDGLIPLGEQLLVFSNAFPFFKMKPGLHNAVANPS